MLLLSFRSENVLLFRPYRGSLPASSEANEGLESGVESWEEAEVSNRLGDVGDIGVAPAAVECWTPGRRENRIRGQQRSDAVEDRLVVMC